eukprot:9478119-Pyramimonas_sp.AAC.1
MVVAAPGKSFVDQRRSHLQRGLVHEVNVAHDQDRGALGLLLRDAEFGADGAAWRSWSSESSKLRAL